MDLKEQPELQHQLEEEQRQYELSVPQVEDQDQSEEEQKVEKPRKRAKKTTHKLEEEAEGISSENSEDIYDNNFIIDKLPTDRQQLQSLLHQVKHKIKEYKQKFLKQRCETEANKSFVGQHSIPICADITKFDFENLMKKQREIANRQFDVIMMDPPWRLSTSQPSRGVAIQYSSLGDEAIESIPVPTLQKQGFIFIWVINAKFQWTVRTMEKKWGYKVIDNINWVKKTVNGKIAKGHGFYLQHAKESCLVGFKGDFEKYTKNIASDVIFSFRRGQSQKPTEIYEYIEKLVPNGYYLEVFGRRNNLRNKWVTIGNEL